MCGVSTTTGKQYFPTKYNKNNFRYFLPGLPSSLSTLIRSSGGVGGGGGGGGGDRKTHFALSCLKHWPFGRGHYCADSRPYTRLHNTISLLYMKGKEAP